MIKKLIASFTKSQIAALPTPTDRDRLVLYDIKVPSLALVVRKSGKRAFHVVKTINGKTERILIGKFPDMSVENARKTAEAMIGQIASGVNPQDDKRKLRSELTLGELYKEYIERHSKVHKKSWKYDEREIAKFYGHWFGRKISDITKREIQLHFLDIAKTSGKYQANHNIERLRGMYNRAIEWGWQGYNPVLGIKKFRATRRDRFIRPNELRHFLRALNDEKEATLRDLFWILLLTGVRKTNAKQMRWDEIMWELKEWRIPDTKNNEPLVIALTERACEILKNRHMQAKSVWVFPQDTDPSKHIVNEKRAFQRIKETATIYSWLENKQIKRWIKPIYDALPRYYNAGTGYETIIERAKIDNITLPSSMVDLRVHDLRRTMGSYQAINGTSLEIIGKSLGHKSLQATQIYARLNLDPVWRF